MRRGLFLPIFDRLADPDLLGALANEAEGAGWDGVFFWDHVYYRPPVEAVTDAWTAMAVAAERTERVLIGPMVTPLARRRPQVLARQAVALDRLSGGRFVLGVGLGLDTSGGELSRFGEETDDRRRAAMLDEALEVLGRCFAGDDVDHRGGHYRVEGRFLPRPVHGRVPVWVAGRWPHRRPLARAARHDGVFLIDLGSPADLAEAVTDLAGRRPGGLDGFEVVVSAEPDGDVAGWEAAGATWCLTMFDPFSVDAAEVRAVLRDPRWSPGR